MKKVTIIFIILLLIVLIATLMNSFSININSKSASNHNLETRENNEGPVSVSVTPLSLDDGSPTWNFKIALNTHSGSIDTDLVTVSELIDSQGKLYKPISWEGDNPGGHHRKGVLKFNPILPKPKSVELKIKNIGGVVEKSFKWNL